MSTATADAPPARLKARYLEEIRPALVERFGYSSVMEAPRVEKVTLNMGVGGAKTDSKVLKSAREQLATIAGQAPSVRRARKSIAAFKLREGNPVGVAVTLRSERAYEFLDRLVSIAIPRIRDFRGLNPRSFDGRGNYSMGVREQIIFPEIDYDAIDEVRGLDITISTSASTDAEAFALLLALGMPFAAQGRPRGFEDPNAPAAADDAETPEAEAPAVASAPEEPVADEPADGEPAADAVDAHADQPADDEPDAEAENVTEPEPEPEAAAEPEAEAQAEPEAAAEPEPESAVEPEPEAAADSEAEGEPAADAEDEHAGEEEPQAAEASADASADAQTAEKGSTD